MHRRPRLMVTAALALLPLAALSACGDDDTEDLGAAVDDAESTVDSLAGVVEDGSVTEEEAAEVVERSANQLRDAVGDVELATLFQTLDTVGFDDIAEAERFTFFAPNDDAFDAIDADLLAELLADPDAFRDVLRDHLLDDVVVAADLSDGGTATTSGGLELTFDLSGDQPTVNGIPIVRTDVTVDDRGVVHVIDGLLLEN